MSCINNITKIDEGNLVVIYPTLYHMVLLKYRNVSPRFYFTLLSF